MPTASHEVTRAKAGSGASFAFRLPFIARNLLRRWRKTVGPTFGVAMALGVVVTLLGIAQGGTAVYTEEFEKSGIDLYLVTHGGAIVSILPGESPGTIDNASVFMNQIRAMPGVMQVVGLSYGPLQHEKEISSTGKKRLEQWFAIGVTGRPETVPGMVVIKEGRWLALGNEIVVAPQLASSKGVGVGDAVIVNDRRLLVVGIGRLNGVGFAGLGSAYLSFDTLRSFGDEGDQVAVV